MLNEQRKKELLEFIEKLDVKIKDLELLDTALTHGSYLKGKKEKKENQDNLLNDNERLEFFGDAVLKLYISEYLMTQFPNYLEGKLSNLRAFVVSEKVLTKVAAKLNLKKYLLLGKNEKKSLPVSIIADSVEALLAVIYYSCGSKIAKSFILQHWGEYIEYANSSKDTENYKAALQEYTQGHDLGLPEYKMTSEEGPDHKKEFEVAVCLMGKEIGRGRGKTKKEASQDAAKSSLKSLGNILNIKTEKNSVKQKCK